MLLHHAIQKKFIEKAINHCLKKVRNSKSLNLHYRDRLYKQQFILDQYIKQQGNATFKAVDDPAGYHGEFMRIVAGLEIPPLMTAAAVNNECLLKKLLRKQHDVNAIDAQGRTPLMYASEFESAKAFDFLLRNAADPAKCCQQGRNALFYATRHGSKKIVKQLEKFTGDLAMRNLILSQDHSGLNAIMLAAELETPEILELFLLYQPDIKIAAVGHGNKTAAMFAAEKGRLKTLNALIDYDKAGAQALIMARDANGKTVLSYASASNNLGITNLLCSLGARYSADELKAVNVNFSDVKRRNLFDGYLVRQLIAYRIEKKLQKLTDIINERDSQGRDIMMYAAMGGKPDIIAFLHAKGASLTASAPGDNNLTPLVNVDAD